MSLHTGTISPTRKPFWRRERFWRFTLPVAAAVALVASGLVVYDRVFGSNGSPNAKNGWGVTYPTPVKPRTVKLDPSVRPLVRRFVETAVARRNVVSAYGISGPEIRQDQTRKEFAAGNIAVVPYLITAKSTIRILRVDYSYANRARVEVFLVTPGYKIHSPHTFFADLVKRGGRWYVNTWVPRWTPPIPTAPGR
jgi:hypothetical protein